MLVFDGNEVEKSFLVEFTPKVTVEWLSAPIVLVVFVFDDDKKLSNAIPVEEDYWFCVVDKTTTPFGGTL